MNPDQIMLLRAFRQRDVDAVDKIVELSRGREDVKTESDWKVLLAVVEFYIRRWPDEWMEFRSTMPDIRQTRNVNKKHGYSDSKEIKYLAAIPLRLERLIKICFPQNQFNKKFSYEFIRRFKAFQVAGAPS